MNTPQVTSLKTAPSKHQLTTHFISTLTSIRTTIDKTTDKIHHRINTIDQHGPNAGPDFEPYVLTNDDDEEDAVLLQERLTTSPTS